MLLTTIAKMLNEKKVQLLLLATVSVLVYLNSLPNTLVWDDHLFIEKWPEIRDVRHLPDLLLGAAPPEQGKIYRPVRSLVYLANYSLWGTNPLGYRIQAVFIHLTVTLLVYGIARLLLKGNIPAFVTALLFAVHPIHTETIDYISASLETVGTVFFFASFYLYMKGNSAKSKVQSPTLNQETTKYLPSAQSKTKLYLTSSIFLALLAFFTYEMTLTLPLLLVLYHLCFDGKKAVFKHLPSYFPYWLGAIVYLFIRTAMLGLVSRTEYLGYSFYHTMLTMVKVFVRYLGLLIAPINLTANHMLVGDFPSSMLPYDRLDPIFNQSLFDTDVLGSIAIIIGLLILGLRMLKKYPVISFSIFWFFISLLPVSYIIPHGGAMAEKYLYIASFGFLLGIVYIFSKIYQSVKPAKKKVMVLLLIIILTSFSWLTIKRNTVWINDITLFTDMVNKSPQDSNLLANYNLGLLYAKEENYQQAINHYQKAIGKAPGFWQARFNLGNIYLRQKKYDLAAEEYRKVLQFNPQFEPAKETLEKVEIIN